MAKINVTRDYQSFVDDAMIESYQEIYDFYQAAIGNTDGCPGFSVGTCNGSDDILITHESMNQGLRLSPKAYEYLPKWIEVNLMHGLDAESFWGLEHAKEKDEIEDKA